MPNAYNSNHTGEWQDDLFNLIYPIGAIYISTSNIDPSILFGGVWQQIEDRFLLAAGTTYVAGATGGEATHALTPSETALRTHTHKQNTMTVKAKYKWKSEATATSGNYWSYVVDWTNSAGNFSGADRAETASNPQTNGITETKGAAHNNMPPYLVVYIWERIE